MTSKTTVHVLGNRKGCFTRHIHPLRVFQRELKALGLEIKLFDSPLAGGIAACDTLLFMEGGYRDILPIKIKDKESALEYLTGFLSQFQKVIWFDDHDSAGMLRTYVFPLVTGYAKAQLLKDTSYYQEDHLTGIPHLDYVHERHGIEDKPRFKGKIDLADTRKLRLGWHLGMINWPFRLSTNRIYRHFILQNARHYKIDYHTADLSARQRPFSYRASMWEKMPLVNWWRVTTREKLQNWLMQKTIEPAGYFGALDRAKFYEEMKQSVVVVSPFGFGEVCYRDFEAFINGCVLLKPDMSHLTTWPDLYVDGETYISHQWDFSDFDEKLEGILAHPERYEAVAREGQARFSKALSDGEAFAQHFLKMLA